MALTNHEQWHRCYRGPSVPRPVLLQIETKTYHYSLQFTTVITNNCILPTIFQTLKENDCNIFSTISHMLLLYILHSFISPLFFIIHDSYNIWMFTSVEKEVISLQSITITGENGFPSTTVIVAAVWNQVVSGLSDVNNLHSTLSIQHLWLETHR